MSGKTQSISATTGLWLQGERNRRLAIESDMGGQAATAECAGDHRGQLLQVVDNDDVATDPTDGRQARMFHASPLFPSGAIRT